MIKTRNVRLNLYYNARAWLVSLELGWKLRYVAAKAEGAWLRATGRCFRRAITVRELVAHAELDPVKREHLRKARERRAELREVGLVAAEEERWPAEWFDRLVLSRKLNDAEYAGYAAAMAKMGLKPDPMVRESPVKPATELSLRLRGQASNYWCGDDKALMLEAAVMLERYNELFRWSNENCADCADDREPRHPQPLPDPAVCDHSAMYMADGKVRCALCDLDGRSAQLWKYGKHLYTCAVWESMALGCTCGWAELRSKLAAPRGFDALNAATAPRGRE